MSLEGGKLLSRTLLMVLFLLADIWMFRALLGGLIEGTLQPAVASILSMLVTAITGALALGAKDFFGPSAGQAGN